MNFWGVEVKGGKPLKVKPPPNAVIHLSQVTLAELKNCPNPVKIYAKHGEQNIVIGMLNADTIPQVSMDLVFEKEIELSHSWKNGAVHLSGYTSFMGEDAGEFSDEDDLMSIEDLQNAAVSLATKAKPVASLAADKKEDKAEDESDDSEEYEDDEDSSDESDSDAEEADGAKSDDLESDSDSEGSDSEEETPVKSAGGKKRSASDTKAPEPKKAKLITPQKSGGKKAGPVHVDTHPAKTAGKGDKSTVKTTPKSLGQVTCGTCNRSFNSKNGLEAHSKAKHSTQGLGSN